MNLKAEQRRLYALMPEDARCFVRVCDDNGALWVSDLSRRYSGCLEMAAKLKSEGFRMKLDEEAQLCYLDWTLERWQEEIAKLPQECPGLPAQEEYHEAFALCRLWLTHPAELEEAHLSTLRCVVKRTAETPDRMLRTVRSLYEEAAMQIRKKKTVAHAAGRVLAAWLYEQTYGKETQT